MHRSQQAWNKNLQATFETIAEEQCNVVASSAVCRDTGDRFQQVTDHAKTAAYTPSVRHPVYERQCSRRSRCTGDHTEHAKRL